MYESRESDKLTRALTSVRFKSFLRFSRIDPRISPEVENLTEMPVVKQVQSLSGMFNPRCEKPFLSHAIKNISVYFTKTRIINALIRHDRTQGLVKN